MLCARANKTCQGETCQRKLGRVCGAFRAYSILEKPQHLPYIVYMFWQNFSLFLSAITQCFQSKFSIPSHGITEPVILYILSYLALLVLYTPKSGAMKYAHIFILSTFFTQIITYKMVELNVIKLHEMVKLLK